MNFDLVVPPKYVTESTGHIVSVQRQSKGKLIAEYVANTKLGDTLTYKNKVFVKRGVIVCSKEELNKLPKYIEDMLELGISLKKDYLHSQAQG